MRAIEWVLWYLMSMYDRFDDIKIGQCKQDAIDRLKAAFNIQRPSLKIIEAPKGIGTFNPGRY